MNPEQDPRLYVRIHAVLARKIRDGGYPAGTKLPTEKQLAEQYGCGTDAAQRALQLLARTGWRPGSRARAIIPSVLR